MIKQRIDEALTEVETLATELDRGPGARELALAKTKLEEATLWLRESERKVGAGINRDLSPQG